MTRWHNPAGLGWWIPGLKPKGMVKGHGPVMRIIWGWRGHSQDRTPNWTPPQPRAATGTSDHPFWDLVPGAACGRDIGVSGFNVNRLVRGSPKEDFRRKRVLHGDDGLKDALPAAPRSRYCCSQHP